MAIAHVLTQISVTANTQTNTSLNVSLGSTTAGDLNVIEIAVKVDGSGVDPVIATPAGWTAISAEAFDSGTTSSLGMRAFYRFYVGGDPSVVTVSWTNAGNAVAISSGYSGVNTSTPITGFQIEPKGATDASYSVSVTTSLTGWIRSGFANRSGHTFSALGDTSRGNGLNTSATSMVAQDTAGDVSAGTYTKTATGSGTTSIGAEWAYGLNSAGAGGVNYSWTVNDGLSLAETITTSSLATVDTYTDGLGLTDSVVRSLNSSPTSTPRTPDFTFTLQLAPTSTPTTASPSYTDVSDYVVLRDEVSLSRGREDEGSVGAQPGRATWTMRNEGGTFTPGDGDSAFAPFQLRRPFRWAVTYDGVSYPLWQGFLDGVSTFRDGTSPRARMSCSDRLARLGGAKTTRLFDVEIAKDNPVWSYPLRDLTPASSSRQTTPLTIRSVGAAGSVSFTSGLSVSGEPDDNAAQFTRGSATAGQELWSPQTGRTDYSSQLYTWAMEVLIAPTMTAKMAAVAGAYVYDPNAGKGSNFPQFISALGTNANGFPFYEDTGGSGVSLTGGSPVPLNQWTHLAVTSRTGDGTKLYVNGVQVAASGSVAQNFPAIMLIGGVTDYTTFTNWGPFDGRIAYANIYDTGFGGPAALSPTRIADHVAVTTGSETTTSRFARLMGATNVPSTMWTVPAASTVKVSQQQTNDRSVLDSINAISKADGGIVYADPGGIITYAPASARYNAPVELVLDTTTMVLAGTEMTTDDALLVNDVTYTGNDGTPVRVTSASSIAAFDSRPDTDTLPTLGRTETLSAATWVIMHRSQPGQRSNGIDINMQAFRDAGGNMPALLSLDNGSRIQVISIADGLAASTSLDLIVEGIKDRFGKGGWVRTLITSPTGLFTSIFALDDPVHGVLDGTQILGL